MACAAGPRTRPIKGGDVDTGGGTLAAARKYLEGRWNLVTYDITPPGAPAIHLDSKNGTGLLTYDDFGNVEMELRVNEATAKILDRGGIETTNGVFSEKGHAAVDLQRKTLTFVLDGQPAFDPSTGPLALKRPRYWEVNGNILTLTTKSDDGKTILSKGRWQKLAQ